MSYNNRGRRRSYNSNRFNRSSNKNKSRRSKQKSIDPNRYISSAVQPQEEVAYTASHTFGDFGLHQQLLENIKRRGYQEPTPIQDQAIPVLMQGLDVVGIANTGTGKTAAFLLPLIDKVLRNSDQGVLVLAPTRELALQIEEELIAFVKGLPIGVALCIGGTNLSRQIQRLKDNPHFVIGTPGRLKDLIERRAFKPELFKSVVLDEVDRMLDIGFRKDVLFLVDKMPKDRHAALFSATINRDTEQIVAQFLHNPETISVKKQETADHVEQDIVKVKPGQNKVDLLHDLLTQGEFQKVIVFGRTKRGINKLERQLYDRRIQVCSIHGNKSQNARQHALRKFKQGRVQALLATDVAARGIDIDGVTHVINYDEPGTYEDYVHRIGRTGRAGSVGKALTFVG